MASYADARHHKGSWLIRVDDIDTPRIVKGSTQSILNSLECFGFKWDEAVQYQSDNQDDYLDVINTLKRLELIYPCYCSRKEIQTISPSGIYPGTCKIPKHSSLKNSTSKSNNVFSLRIDTSQQATISFTDRIQGKKNYQLSTLSGDFIVCRSDQIIAYLLAFVADIHFDGITHVVRGYDLLDSTAKHLYLQNILCYPIPKYAHIPIICNSQGVKLSKSCAASAVKPSIKNLIRSAEILGQKLDKHIKTATISEFWRELIKIWDINNIPKVERIYLSS
jgi:glutamyl-Q tRNA(Asp) synthetase